MKSLNPTYHLNKSETRKWNNYHKVYKYLKKRLICRKYNTRPLELTYLKIGKKLKISYKQVRLSIDLLVLNEEIVKYNAWHIIQNTGEQKAMKKQYYKRNFYVWNFNKPKEI